MEIAMRQFKVSVNFYMKLYFEQIFRVSKICLGLVLLKITSSRSESLKKLVSEE